MWYVCHNTLRGVPVSMWYFSVCVYRHSLCMCLHSFLRLQIGTTSSFEHLSNFYCIQCDAVPLILIHSSAHIFENWFLSFCSIWFSNFYQFSSIVFHFKLPDLMAIVFFRRNWDIKWALKREGPSVTLAHKKHLSHCEND